MIPIGKYVARAQNAELGYTQNGTEQVGVPFRIVEGPQEGQTITWYGFFSDKCVDRTLQSLRHCGWKGDDLTDLSTVGDEDVELDIIHDTHQGKTKAKVAWVNQIGGGGMKNKMGAAEAAAFAERMYPKIQRMPGAKSVESDADESVPF